MRYSHFCEIHAFAQKGGVLFVVLGTFLSDVRNPRNPLAKELGISSGAVTRWKNAEDPPSGKTLMLLADKLDCSVDYLLGRTDDPVLHQLDSSSSSAI